MSEVKELLTAIRSLHAARKRKIAKYFQPGRDQSDLGSLELRWQASLPPEWHEMYQVFDGVDPGDTMSFKAGWVFLDWTWESTEMIERLINSELRDSPSFRSGDIPIGLSTNRTPFLFLATGQSHAMGTPIVGYRPGNPNRFVVFDNIVGMLRSAHEAMDCGTVSSTANGEISYVAAEIAAIVLKHNRRSDYWARFA